MKYAEIEFGFFDATSKGDGSFSSNDGKSWVDLTQLDDDYTTPNYYIDNQWNYTILDGEHDLRTTTQHGFISNEMSDENGDFTTNPVITREYNNTHSTIGLGFTFGEEGCPKQIKITYYSSSTQIAQYTDDVDSSLYFSRHEVDDYDKWTIELIGTKVPYRYAQLVEVHYGVFVSWTDEDIVNCNIIEELDLASNEMPIKELSFSIKDLTGEYNVLNPDGLFSFLTEGQPLIVREYIDGTKANMGTFYLDTWQSTTGNMASFTAHDILGELDKSNFVQTDIWENKALSVAIRQVVGDGAEIVFTDLDLAEELVNGYIPICTRREALQELCFCARCYCVSGRDDKLHFYRLNKTDRVIALGDDVVANMQMELGDTINEIDVSAYTITGETEKVWGDYVIPSSYSKDTYLINYDKPVADATFGTTGALTPYLSVAEQNMFNMLVQGISSVSGNKTIYVNGIDLNKMDETIYVAKDDEANVLYPVEVKGLYLIDDSNAQDIADYLYEYYQMKISQNFKLLLSNEEIGNRVALVVGGYTKIGRITKLDIDLANGFIANAKVVSEV